MPVFLRTGKCTGKITAPRARKYHHLNTSCTSRTNACHFGRRTGDCDRNGGISSRHCRSRRAVNAGAAVPRQRPTSSTSIGNSSLIDHARVTVRTRCAAACAAGAGNRKMTSLRAVKSMARRGVPCAVDQRRAPLWQQVLPAESGDTAGMGRREWRNW